MITVIFREKNVVNLCVLNTTLITTENDLPTILNLLQSSDRVEAFSLLDPLEDNGVVDTLKAYGINPEGFDKFRPRTELMK